MYTQSREFRDKLPDSRTDHVILAQFDLPKQLESITGGVKLKSKFIRQHSYPSLNSSNIILSETRPVFSVGIPLTDPTHVQSIHAIRGFTPQLRKPKVETPITELFCIFIEVGDTTWKFGADKLWLVNLVREYNVIKGSIHFRSKYHGAWEPFEFLKYIVIRRSDLSLSLGPELVWSIFSQDLLGKSHHLEMLEMTLKLECILVPDEEWIFLSIQKSNMDNALLPLPQKSDLSIRVENEDFLVHMRYIKAFSAVSEVFLKYIDQSNMDWSDVMTPCSMRALLRFIYYNEVDAIAVPDVAFRLFQFGHMYQQTALVHVCEKKLMSFNDAMYTLPSVLDMYMYFRISEEFQKLKTHFCGILSRNSRNYNTRKLTALAQSYDSGLGVQALVEILQFKDPKA